MPAPAAPPFRLVLVTDPAAVPDGDLARALDAALAGGPAGAVAVQLRSKALGGRALLEAALALRALTRRAGARLLVNDRVDVALACEADGAHLPGGGLPVAEARRLLGAGPLIGVSTHAPAEVAAAAAAGADYAILGPIYATPSKLGYGPPLGPAALTAAADSGLPVYAIGGVDATNAAACRAAGAAGVAVIRAVLAAPAPAAAVAAILGALAAAPPQGA